MKTFYIFSLVLCLAVTLHAQKAEPQATLPPFPPGPLIQKRASDFAQWVIKAEAILEKGKLRKAGQQSKTGEDSQGGMDTELQPSWGAVVTIAKTGKIMLRQMTDGQNRVWNTWCIGQIQTTVTPDGKNWMMQSRNPDPNIPTVNYEDYSQTDFPGFEWISLNNYRGIRELNGRKCLYFQGGITSEYDSVTATAAYIDLETRYPVALNVGGESHTYEFKPPPKSMLTLPSLVQELLENRQKLMRSATRRPAR